MSGWGGNRNSSPCLFVWMPNDEKAMRISMTNALFYSYLLKINVPFYLYIYETEVYDRILFELSIDLTVHHATLHIIAKDCTCGQRSCGCVTGNYSPECSPLWSCS